jgi:hypothetical protein
MLKDKLAALAETGRRLSKGVRMGERSDEKVRVEACQIIHLMELLERKAHYFNQSKAPQVLQSG